LFSHNTHKNTDTNKIYNHLAGIGIFYAIKGYKHNTTKEFLMGGRQMQLVPIAISIKQTSNELVRFNGYNKGTNS
jgi:hypothetical protein